MGNGLMAAVWPVLHAHNFSDMVMKFTEGRQEFAILSRRGRRIARLLKPNPSLWRGVALSRRGMTVCLSHLNGNILNAWLQINGD